MPWRVSVDGYTIRLRLYRLVDERPAISGFNTSFFAILYRFPLSEEEGFKAHFARSVETQTGDVTVNCET
jgi:hypothetical protein